MEYLKSTSFTFNTFNSNHEGKYEIHQYNIIINQY